MTLELGPETASRLLEAYGHPGPWRVEPLPGGVSSRVVLAQGPGQRVVLKQPRRRFAVAADWQVDERRVYTEFAFLRTLGPALREQLARPVFFAPQFHVLATEAAPASYRPWKERLLSGLLEPAVPVAAAKLLRRLQEAGSAAPAADRFRNDGLFEQQRLEPFFDHSARQSPLLFASLRQVRGLAVQGDALVHGDFTPKNLLTDGERVVLVDHEVCTRGHPAFDAGLMLAHLVLKAIRRGGAEDGPARRFYEEYVRLGGVAGGDLFLLLGGFLIARVLGKGPVDYLSPAQQVQARSLGQVLLHHPVRDWEGLEDRLRRVLAAG